LSVNSREPSGLLRNRTLGLLGAGNMAEALIRGVLNAGSIQASAITASDVSPDRRQFIANALKIRATENNQDVVSASQLIVLCVKPQQTDDVLKQIAAVFRPDFHVLASICAGVPTARIERNLPAGARIVRVMPNTPMLVGLGASCLCAGAHTRGEDLAVFEELFSSASLTLRVEERMMDAVTGLSGSGPAYLFYLVEAMVDAGIAEGFSREDATMLASRTVLGAAKMLEETKLAPEELRRRVTSPNGTTQAAVERLDASEVKTKVVQAIRRAAERSRELGKQS
jgi:pyrroline-5-carboxylate reductase